jgi:hypothetical protein
MASTPNNVRQSPQKITLENNENVVIHLTTKVLQKLLPRGILLSRLAVCAALKSTSTDGIIDLDDTESGFV